MSRLRSIRPLFSNSLSPQSVSRTIRNYNTQFRRLDEQNGPDISLLFAVIYTFLDFIIASVKLPRHDPCFYEQSKHSHGATAFSFVKPFFAVFHLHKGHSRWSFSTATQSENKVSQPLFRGQFATFFVRTLLFDDQYQLWSSDRNHTLRFTGAFVCICRLFKRHRHAWLALAWHSVRLLGSTADSPVALCRQQFVALVCFKTKECERDLATLHITPFLSYPLSSVRLLLRATSIFRFDALS
jgi:hypothetical protein